MFRDVPGCFAMLRVPGFIDGLDIKTIVHENDPANLPLFEAFYIRGQPFYF